MRRLTLAVMTLGLWAATVLAGPMPGGFEYRTVVTADPFLPAGGGSVPGGPLVYAAATNGYAAAEFSNVGPWSDGTSGAAFTATTVKVHAATSLREDFSAVFNSIGTDGTYPGGYTLSVGVKDLASGEIAEFAFRGLFTGSIDYPRFGTVTASFLNAPAGPTTMERTVGGALYRVTLGDFGQPGLPVIRVGDIPYEQPDGAGITTATITRIGDVAETPEPATIALAGMGLAIVVARRRRGR